MLRTLLSPVFFVALSLSLPGAGTAQARPAAGLDAPEVAPTALRLIPMPRRLTAGAVVSLRTGLKLVCVSCTTDTEDSSTLSDLKEALAVRQIGTASGATVTLVRVSALSGLPAEAQAEGYTIKPAAGGLELAAATSTGLFYAAQTFKQMISGNGAAAVLLSAVIEDWPATRYRGVHDDLSRGPVPTLTFQKELVRTLAEYKVNVYSPYFEHTQQYASNPLFAPPGGSISAADAEALVKFAGRYHVTVIPEQEAFGHLHHNLTWEQYAPLAETPHGTVLAPGEPGSLALIGQMFGELAKLYPGPFLHIGADETVDLGLGRTKAEVDARGLGPVYLAFLERIATTLQPLHRRLLFWGDIAQSIGHDNPNLLRDLSAAFKQATVAVAWEYNPQPKSGFARFLAPFTAAGFETWVSPGISNWSRVWPNANDALSNIQGFAAEGQRQHSTGLLNTVWYDDGEALANNNWYGLLFGAAAGWQVGTSSIDVFRHSYGVVFHGDQTGALDQAQTELAACHSLLRNEAKVGDGSDGLFWIDPWSKDGQTIAGKIRPHTHELRLHAERALTLIAQARAAYPAPEPDLAVVETHDPAHALPSNPTTLRHADAIDAMELGARRLDLIGLKFHLTDEIVAGYNQALSAAGSPDRKIRATVGPDLTDINGINGRIEDLRGVYALLRDLYEQAWLRSNRAYGLRPVLEHYDQTVMLWQGRADRVRSAQRQFSEKGTLPPAAEAGLPGS